MSLFYIRFYISVLYSVLYIGEVDQNLQWNNSTHLASMLRSKAYCNTSRNFLQQYVEVVYPTFMNELILSVTQVDGHWYASIGGNIVDTIYLADFNRNYNWGFSANRINFLVFFSKRDCRYLSQLIWLLYISELNLSWFD